MGPSNTNTLFSLFIIKVRISLSTPISIPTSTPHMFQGLPSAMSTMDSCNPIQVDTAKRSRLTKYSELIAVNEHRKTLYLLMKLDFPTALSPIRIILNM